MELKINIVERFAEWLTHEGKAVATIASYINDVKQFNQYLAVKDVDPEVLLTRFLLYEAIRSRRNGSVDRQ